MNNRYQRVVVPDIIYIPRDKLENCSYIKTARAGHGTAHIMSRGKYYYVCLRPDNNIPFDNDTQEILGFRRNSLHDCDKLLDIFNVAADKELEKRGYVISPPASEDLLSSQTQ